MNLSQQNLIITSPREILKDFHNETTKEYNQLFGPSVVQKLVTTILSCHHKHVMYDFASFKNKKLLFISTAKYFNDVEQQDGSIKIEPDASGFNQKYDVLSNVIFGISQYNRLKYDVLKDFEISITDFKNVFSSSSDKFSSDDNLYLLELQKFDYSVKCIMFSDFYFFNCLNDNATKVNINFSFVCGDKDLSNMLDDFGDNLQYYTMPEKNNLFKSLSPITKFLNKNPNRKISSIYIQNETINTLVMSCSDHFLKGKIFFDIQNNQYFLLYSYVY